ncbi:hypothetical protein K523DRAFT_37338 [Schizophyllum commune Tattone D]|nr:hypothetical protein K523DRAFT_37338 [Schizophyllum commune Tattone D]
MVALDHERYLEDIVNLILVGYPGLVALFSNIPRMDGKKQDDIDLYGIYTLYRYLYSIVRDVGANIYYRALRK